MRFQERSILALAGALWLSAGLGGGAMLYHYAYSPADRGAIQAFWPKDSRLKLNAGSDTLVVAVHPHCPCTRASMEELNDLMLSLGGKVKAYVLVIKPEGFPAGWEDTEVVRRAREIPGVTVVLDPDGVEAGRFGARTSGEAALYDASGRLEFNGGLTASRGHVGDNAGVERITRWVETGKADRSSSLVYGCPLNAKFCVLERTDGSMEKPKGEGNGQ